MRLNLGTIIFLFFLLSANTMGAFTTDVYIPALPAIAHSLGTTNSLVQLTISIYFFSFSFSTLLFGPLSDSTGRKAIIILGLLFAIPATYVCYQATTINWLLFGRFLQGLGLGALIASTRAIAPDTFKGKNLARVMSLLTMTMPLFLSIAPVVGGYIVYYFDWQSIFFVLLCYLLVLLIYYTLVFKDSHHTKHEHTLRSSFKSMGQLLSNKLFMIYGTYPAIIFIAISAYFTASPFLFQELLGLSARAYGELAIVVGAVIILGGAINTSLLKKYAPQQLLRVAEVAIFIAGILLLLMQLFSITNVYSLFVPCLIFFIAIPFGFPNANSIAYTHIKGGFGAAGSLIVFIQIFSGFAVSGLFSYFLETTYYPLAAVFLLCAAIGRLYFYKASQFENQINALDYADFNSNMRGVD